MFTSLIYFKLIFESGEHLCILTVAFSMESQKYAVLNWMVFESPNDLETEQLDFPMCQVES